MARDNTFSIVIDKFFQGFSPLAYLNSLTEMGNGGHASVMTNADVLGDVLTQGPGLANLTAGTQAAAVTELIQFILDKAVASDVTYAIGTSKLFKISSTAVTNAGDWPHAITNCTDGESVIDMGGNLYYFFNKSSGGEIGKYDLSSTFDDDWGSTTPTGAAALQKAAHPSFAKEDIIAFGNGQYLGIYTGDNNTLAPTKLDFKAGNGVDDVIFSSNQWLVAVNGGVSGTNRNVGQIFMYDGGAISGTLSDETGVGFQRIGFLYEVNGIVYVAYQDLSSTGFKIGYVAGRQVKALGSFTGSLPTFAQKTLYKHTILFLSSGAIWSAGAILDEFPFQMSQLADGGYATCGAIAAPFGTPMVASTDGGGVNFRLAKFSGYDQTSVWKSIVFPVSAGKYKGYIDNVTVLTNSLGTGAAANLTLEANQAASTSNTLAIATSGKTRHYFGATGLGQIEDFRVALALNGSASNPVQVRRIIVNGHFVQST